MTDMTDDSNDIPEGVEAPDAGAPDKAEGAPK